MPDFTDSSRLESTSKLQDIGDEEDVEVATEFALELLTKFLADAQVAGQRLERRRERESGRKRKRGTYKGTSKQTLWRNKKAAERLKAKGFTSISAFFKPKAPVESTFDRFYGPPGRCTIRMREDKFKSGLIKIAELLATLRCLSKSSQVWKFLSGPQIEQFSSAFLPGIHQVGFLSEFWTKPRKISTRTAWNLVFGPQVGHRFPVQNKLTQPLAGASLLLKYTILIGLSPETNDLIFGLALVIRSGHPVTTKNGSLARLGLWSYLDSGVCRHDEESKSN
ncbi:hypothetical protein B0H14DRAFT_2569324 [Mycena olivaceomarginata]|nr:hypothetical protein B0H14DRAFT_2569324 [Mycena olivaceomarginata]